MSVASDLNSRKAKLQTILQNTNAEIAAKGGSSASTIASIPAAVASIAGGAELEEVTITPNGQQIVALPEEGYDGFSKVTVSGDANLVAANIKAGVTIYGVTGTMSGGVSEKDIPVPTDYQSYVATAKTLYIGDYAGLIILDSGANTVAVCFMMDDFSIESYNEFSTWFSMTGAYYCRYTKDTDTWEQLDYLTSVSTGEHYGNHIKFATRVLFFGDIQVWPRESSGGGSVEIVPWATGTDEQIAAMVAALDAGTLFVEETGWQVGDERTVNLSAMAATGVGESHAAQTATLVLMDSQHYELAKATTGGSTMDHFVVGLKNSLKETGYMNATSTNAGGWDECARRAWCNNVFREAIPEPLRSCFKQFNVMAAYNSSEGKTSIDYFALFGSGEIFESTSNPGEGTGTSQIEWYKTASNRIKKLGDDGSANYWWERSLNPAGGNLFRCVNSNGVSYTSGANSTYGLAPFGCI